MKQLLTSLLVILYYWALITGEAHYPSDSNQNLGVVWFSTSCAKASQKAIEHGIALLHSFLFDDAEDQFKTAVSEDSACAMAYWAEAIGLYRPLAYRPTDSDMKQGWELVEKAQTLHPKTQRERDYVEALAAFYRADRRDYDTRNRQYSEAMEKVYKSYSDDQEAAVFYALSLLTWDQDSQHPLANSERAIGILNPVFRDNPDHPGVAHYLIHAADSPQLAQMGLEAARRYAQIAPAAPHALHMPSHIFARLGLWQEDIQSNLASLKAARNPTAVHVGAENQLHAMEFLEYAYLQVGETEKAKEMVREQAEIGYEQVDKNLVDYVNQTRANCPAMFYLESRDWKSAQALKPDPNAETYNQAITYWAQAVAAGHLRDLAAAQNAVKQYDSLLEATRQGSHSYRAKHMNTKRDEAHAWFSFLQGKDDEALGLLRAVANKQDIEGKGEVELPAREMLANMLLEMNRPAEALAEFQNSIRVDPNRFNALYGASQAAELTHQTEKAATYHAQLLANCENGINSTRPELARARAAEAKSGDLHFSGEVSHGQEFRQAISGDLLFVLDPLDDGWTLSVFPATQCTIEGHDDFVAVATAPFFGSNPRFIDTSNEKQSVHSSPRDFQFVLDCKSYRRESELVGTASAGNVSQKASAKAIAKLGASVMGSGKLTILDSRVVKSGKDEAGNDLQQVDWLKFQVDLVLPPGLQRSR